MPRSMPYKLLLAAIGLGISAYLFIMFDQVAVEIFASGTWGTGGEDVNRGQGYIREMWDRALLLILTGVGASVLISARSDGGGVFGR